MKFLSALALVLSLGLAVGMSDAEAKRIGGGKSTGMQRQGTTEKAPTATPAQTPGTPAAAAAPASASAGATAAAAAPKRSWMGPLAGIAAGLGIAALASHLGFGEELASMLMMGLLAFAVIAVIGFIMRKRAAAQGGQNGMAYAGVGAGNRVGDFTHRLHVDAVGLFAHQDFARDFEQDALVFRIGHRVFRRAGTDSVPS